MEQWTEVRRRVLTGELSKRQARQQYALLWQTLKKMLEQVEPRGPTIMAKSGCRPNVANG